MTHVKQIITGQIEENCYLIYGGNTLLIVDPGNDAEKIKAEIAKINARPKAILITHAHYDHIGAVEELRKTYDVPVYISPIEQEWLTDPKLNFSGLFKHDDMPDIIVQPAEFEFIDYDTYKIGDLGFKVVPTPGHSPGSVSFIFDEFVVSGDALFSGSIGRTDLPFGDSQTLLDSIQRELFTLPDEMVVYPGHREPTTIGKEKQTNPFFN
ncbi:MBL fold metallo-hydrolase [Vagococcus penaei]|uniref:MBL fold metallo-hydrolase n=1 Tax=Vagococcus penaei TaxID=633807 RepID=A0A1Q2D4P0_9ENTE|nr:MBL fold metallo-hydrolase [Vagococcus penaei]AQP53225.1 MBL fold metallo-hydrolase [Vagococcus penaei]RST98671.1 MBL fold metallo-hydrolase [Vagococcus penaei]